MADLILFNANVLTMDSACPSAQLIAIQDNRIIAVGKKSDLREFQKRNTKTIDCKGKTVLPGFIDVHCHLHALAESYVTLSLEPRHNVRSVSDIQTKIKDLSQKLPTATWIRGRGYNEFYLAEKRHPNRWGLDQVASTHPIKLIHRTGHAHVLNSLALNMVGISSETPDPPDGLIDRDIQTGEPTGLLYRMGDYLSKKFPHWRTISWTRGCRQQMMSFYPWALRQFKMLHLIMALSSGITGPGSDQDNYLIIRGETQEKDCHVGLRATFLSTKISF